MCSNCATEAVFSSAMANTHSLYYQNNPTAGFSLCNGSGLIFAVRITSAVQNMKIVLDDMLLDLIENSFVECRFTVFYFVVITDADET